MQHHLGRPQRASERTQSRQLRRRKGRTLRAMGELRESPWAGAAGARPFQSRDSCSPRIPEASSVPWTLNVRRSMLDSFPGARARMW